MILDTNALSGWADSDKKVERVVAAQTLLALPVIVLGEFRFGLSGSKLQGPLEERLAVMEQYVLILDVTRSTAQNYAEIRAELKRVGTSIPSNDVWIAALAREHALPILSQDAHFDSVKGVKRVDW